MSAIEIEFMKNKSRFKTLHYEDQVRLMKEYKKYGTYPRYPENPEKLFQTYGMSLQICRKGRQTIEKHYNKEKERTTQ